ncbi:MAG: hypothetical protein ACYTFG_17915 [Planctomycetota bacterium]|jgi:hypothetical protein
MELIMMVFGIAAFTLVDLLVFGVILSRSRTARALETRRQVHRDRFRSLGQWSRTA